MPRNPSNSDILARLQAPEGSVCIYCKTDTNDELTCGKIITKHGVTVHYYCMLFSCGLAQQENTEEGLIGFHIADIEKELTRGKRLRCAYCKKTGGTVGCYNNYCRKSFHLPCGLKNKSLHQFFGVFKSYCSKHRPMQSVPPYEENSGSTICPICLDTVENKITYDTIWAHCCKTSWFHRTCVQKQALSAGYFFRCPLCNNCEDFKKEMEIYGIYIPEKDASWELEENAYQDLLFRYSHCDASCCLCPKGRSHKSTGRWGVILCTTCGSRGCHKGCEMLNESNIEWECNDCQSIRQKNENNSKDAAPEIMTPVQEVITEGRRGRKRSLPMRFRIDQTESDMVQKSPASRKYRRRKRTSIHAKVTPRRRRSCSNKVSVQKQPKTRKEVNQQPTHNYEKQENNKSQQTLQNCISAYNNILLGSSSKTSTDDLNNTQNEISLKQTNDVKKSSEKTKQFTPTKKFCMDCGNSKSCIKFFLKCLQPICSSNACTSECSFM